MYLLTIKSGKVTTRVQVGCLNEFTFDMLAYADLTDQFFSFRTIKTPLKREPEEIVRVDSFIKHAKEWSDKTIKRVFN